MLCAAAAPFGVIANCKGSPRLHTLAHTCPFWRIAILGDARWSWGFLLGLVYTVPRGATLGLVGHLSVVLLSPPMSCAGHARDPEPQL